ncbi:uncharacterized protein LOC112048860 [Bicyclus anynana]|uniref:Uncharacterized protein LOC112048860 n=1 Tax=Bicyclus anynana TaxID=110368 RepID=A0A6J1NB89_BICAN|nr:uncharacterized protein LOC112048860 [Bicyclus anynana]
MQSPTGVFYGSIYQFGNYDQCMKAPWLETHSEYRTKYCLADIKLTNEEPKHSVVVDPNSTVKSYINSASKHGVTFNIISSGMCVPVECNAKAVSKIVHTMFRHTHLGLTIPIAEVSINPCEISGVKAKYPMQFNLIMYGLGFFVTAAILCTLLNINSNHPQNDNVGNKIIKAFCMRENMNLIYKVNDNNITTINGIRSMTTGLVVFVHIWVVNGFHGTINNLDVDRDYEKYKLYFLNPTLMVDTYLVMSGLLLFRGLISSKSYNPLSMILKRYMRFFWILGLILIVIIYVMPYISDGPVWQILMHPEIDICRKNWWITLLMLGNYVDTENICYTVLWSIPCDFHLSIVGILLFSLYRKNRRIAYATFTIILIASIVMSGVVTYQNNLPAFITLDISSVKNLRKILMGNPAYTQSHLRAGPYLIGFAFGYLISIYKLDKRKTVFSTTDSIIGFAVSFGVALMVMITGGIFYDKNKTYNAWEAITFATLNRNVWAIALACLIAFCEYGTVPVISALLKSETFVSYSKLCYGTYLLHAIVYSRIVTSTRSPLDHNMYLILFNLSGVLVFCWILSVFLHLFFEAPMSKITKIMFQTTKTNINREMKKHEYENDGSNKQKKIS